VDYFVLHVLLVLGASKRSRAWPPPHVKWGDFSSLALPQGAATRLWWWNSRGCNFEMDKKSKEESYKNRGDFFSNKSAISQNQAPQASRNFARNIFEKKVKIAKNVYFGFDRKQG
jgi:hypothetical protein